MSRTGGCMICGAPLPANMQELGIRNDVVQAVLNHAVPGVGGVYLRAELEKQKAEALATWATALTRIVGPVRVTA